MGGAAIEKVRLGDAWICTPHGLTIFFSLTHISSLTQRIQLSFSTLNSIDSNIMDPGSHRLSSSKTGYLLQHITDKSLSPATGFPSSYNHGSLFGKRYPPTNSSALSKRLNLGLSLLEIAYGEESSLLEPTFCIFYLALKITSQLTISYSVLNPIITHRIACPEAGWGR